MEDGRVSEQFASNIIEQLADENIGQIEITIVQSDGNIQVDGDIQTINTLPQGHLIQAENIISSEGNVVNDDSMPTEDTILPGDNDYAIIQTVSNDHQDSPGLESPRKKVKRSNPGSSKKYRKGWESLPEYESWLTESTTEGYAFCMVCECDINVDKGKTQLTRHVMRQKHIENEKAVRRGEMSRRNKEMQGMMNNERDTDLVPERRTVDIDVKQKGGARADVQLLTQTQLAEAQLVAFIVENNLPISLIDRLVGMIKDLPSIGSAIKKIHLGKQKATNMVRQGFAPFFKDILVEKLKDTLFSFIIEEVFDKTKKSMLTGFFVCFCNKDLKTEVDLLEFVECDGSPEATYNKLKNCLNKIEQAGVSVKNWIGFRSDASVGDSSQSLSNMISKEYPWVVSIKCPVHMTQLAASSACENLPKCLEDFLHIIHYNLSSSKQAVAYAKFQEIMRFNMEKVLAPGQTQWLSVHSLLKQIVIKWEDLQEHFTNVVIEDTSNGNDLALETLLNPIMKVLTLFVEYILDILDNFCATFQMEEPLFYNLEQETHELIRTLAKACMTREYVAAETDLMNLCVSEESNYLPLSQTYLGYEATAALTVHMQQCQLGFDDNDVILALSSAREFYKALIIQVQTRFNFSHPIFKFVNIINPMKAYNTEPASLMEFFTNFVHPQWSKRAMEEEWRSVCLLGLPTDEVLHSPTAFWKFVLSRKTPTGMNRFKHLTEVLLFFLSLPYSNAINEKIGSLMKDIQTNPRRCLKTVTLSACLRSHCGLRRVPDALNNPHLRKRLEKVKSNAKSGDCNDIPILMAD